MDSFTAAVSHSCLRCYFIAVLVGGKEQRTVTCFMVLPIPHSPFSGHILLRLYHQLTVRPGGAISQTKIKKSRTKKEEQRETMGKILKGENNSWTQQYRVRREEEAKKR